MPAIVARVIRIAILVAVMSGLLYLYSRLNQPAQEPTDQGQTPTPTATPAPRSEGLFHLSQG